MLLLTLYQVIFFWFEFLFCFDALFNSSENDFVALENLLHEKKQTSQVK